jgi:phasin
MTKQSFDFSVPPEMRALAQQSVEQARRAFDGFMTAAGQAAAGFERGSENARGGARNVAQQAMAFAEQNVESSLELAQKLMGAKDLSEVMQLHTDYVRRQMEALATQARQLGEAATRSGRDGDEPPGR